MAYQIGFDLYESATQDLLSHVMQGLRLTAPVPSLLKDATGKETTKSSTETESDNKSEDVKMEEDEDEKEDKVKEEEAQNKEEDVEMKASKSLDNLVKYFISLQLTKKLHC